MKRTLVSTKRISVSTKRTFVFGALVLALMLVISACGTPATPPPPPTNVPQPTAAPVQPTAAPVQPTAVPSTGLPDLAGRAITVAIENAYIPFNYLRLDNGKAEGWDYDALAEICKRLNCKADFKEIAWDGMITAVSQGQFDMAADGITITEERAKTVDFSDGYIAINQRIMVGKDDTTFTNIDSFKNSTTAKLGTQKGTTNYDEAVKLVGEARVVAFDTFGDAVQALIAKDVDGVVIDDTAGAGYVGVNADKIKLLDGTLVGQELGFVFPKGSALVKPFNDALAAMKADGSLAAINKKWFGGAQLSYDDTKAPGYAAAPADEWGEVVVKKGDTIKAGFSAALTGDLAVYGLDMQVGAQMATEKFGADINGFKLEIVSEDDQCSGAGGTTVGNKIVANTALVAHVGFMCSSGEIPGTEILEKANISSISPSATAVQVTARGLKTVFRTAFNDAIQGPAIANFVGKELKLTKTAVIHDGSPYGQGLAEAFAAAFKAGGGTVVGDTEAITVGEKDFRSTLTKVAAAQPELIFFGGFWPEAAVLVVQKNEVGLDKAVFMSADGTFTPKFIETAGAAAQGVYASFGSSQQGSSYADYVKAYEVTGAKRENIVFSPQTYDAVNVLVAALKAASKVNDAGDLVVGRKALNDAIRATKLDGVTGAIAFDATGDRPPESTNVVINQVKGPEWVQVFPAKAAGPTGPDEWGTVTVKKGDTIKASFSAALTGDLAQFGLDMQLGAQMAAENFGGDINGFKLEIVSEDDQCSGPGGTTIGNKIVANTALVGHVGFMCSSGEIPGTEILDKAHIVSVSPSATAVQVTARGLATVNRTAFNDAIQGPAVANFVLKELKLTKAGVIHDGSPYGQGLAQAFADAFKAAGGTVVGDQEAVTVGEKDFRSILTKLAANAPDVIYFGGFWPEAAVLVVQKNEVGLDKATFVSSDGTYSPKFIETAAAAAQGQYASFGSSQQGSSYADFVKAYEAKGGKKENIVFSPQTYDAVNVLVAALKAAAIVDADGNLVIGRKALADAVRAVKLDGVTGGITFDKNGDRPPESTNVVIYQVKGTEWVQVFPPQQ